MATESKLQLDKFQYGIDIRKGRSLYEMSGKKLYMGKWITREEQTVVIVEMNRAIAEREACFYRELNNHDHIIRTFGEVENISNLTIFVQEYARYGDLANIFIDNEIHFCSSMFLEIFAQIVDGMIYIANKSIVHGDLACRNILVYRIASLESKNILVKLTDFGLARLPSTVDNSSIIPIRYCAPEILQYNHQSNYTQKSDIYSMGVLMWEALSIGEIPYSSIVNDDDVKQKKLNDEKLIQPINCDRELWKIMGKCWAFNPKDRITFEEMKEQLSKVIIVDLSDIQVSTITHQSPIVCKYRLNVDVQMTNKSLNGSYGKTVEAQWLSKEKQQDIVILKLNEQPSESEVLFYSEMKSHPHIIHTFGFVENTLQSTLVLQERAPYGNLHMLLKKPDEFQPSTEVLIEIFQQIIDAMIYITKEKLVHGDLRCANVLVFKKNNLIVKENTIKLSNFTSTHRNNSCDLKEKRSKLPFRYCAPEILRSVGRSNYSELSDVYSMGVLMWEACSNGEIPYHSCQLNSEIQQRKLKGEQLSEPWLCNDYVWNIMKGCWYNAPELRFNFEEIKILLSQINLKHDKIFKFKKDINIKIGEKLHGEFGKVFHTAEWIPNKMSSILVIMMDEKTARQEVPYYCLFDSHPHIIHSYGLIENNPRLTMLVQERAPHGNLQCLLKQKEYKPLESVLVHIFLQIIEAMIYIIGQHVIHGNLCCENVLVFKMNSLKPEENLIKLTNFSQACRDDSLAVSSRETALPIRYCAPEILDGRKYSEMSDVYSMGVLMWETYSTGSIPYAAITDNNAVRRCILEGEKLLRPQKCCNQIWSIMNDCWYRTPEIRFQFQDMRIQLSQICVTYVFIDGQTLDKVLYFVRRCEYCESRYLTEEISCHQTSCGMKPAPNPPIPSIPIPAPPPPPTSKSVFQRIRSFFSRKK